MKNYNTTDLLTIASNFSKNLETLVFLSDEQLRDVIRMSLAWGAGYQELTEDERKKAALYLADNPSIKDPNPSDIIKAIKNKSSSHHKYS